MTLRVVDLVGNNTDRGAVGGGESVLEIQQFFSSINRLIYATSVNSTCGYMELCLEKTAYILQTYYLVS